MANQKISQLTELAEAPATDDVLPVVDTSATTTKKIQWTTIRDAVATYLASLTQTLTNKTINLTSNTVTGTAAQFNTALSDGDFATIAGSETLTNKTLTTPTIASFANSTHTHQNAAGGGQLDHGAALTGLTDDDHTQYALLAGRSGGQTITGGTASGDSVTIRSTSNATKGDVLIADQGGNVVVGGGATASEIRLLEPSGSGTNYTAFKAQAQSGDLTYTLPASHTTDGYLKNNGSGGLTWTTVSGGSGFSSRARAYNGAAQTFANNTTTKVQLPTESYDGSNEFDSSTNYRFTATDAGYYFVVGLVTFSSNTTGVRDTTIKKNGSTNVAKGSNAAPTGGGNVTRVLATDIVSLSASDYLELFAYQDSGGNLDTIGGTEQTYLAVHRIS